ncbi:MAG: DUF4142 domain-containing protein [Armatimonadetes bacterium]|nr:DUF4142 domain-containing protein [Armatimonadota bacterium]
MRSRLVCFCVLLTAGISLGASAQTSSDVVRAPVAAGPKASTTTTNPNDLAIAVDADSVYVVQNGMLYRYSKCDIGCAGTPIPPAACGAGPSVCPPGGQGMSYIPGLNSNLTITSSTPTTIPVPQPPGAGPAACDPCAPLCPARQPCCPSSIVSCTPPEQCPCPKIQPCPDPCEAAQCHSNCIVTTSTAPGGPGAGPGALPCIGAISACAQETINCLNQLCGVDADRAYLQAIMQLNLQILSVSDAASVRLGSTRLQDFATNSIADSRQAISKAQKWLRTKYCLEVQACTPALSAGFEFDICNLKKASKEFDDAYKNQVVQLYLDEIALSQVELQRGLDCQVKEFATDTIKNNQTRIAQMKRCTICGP